MSEPRFVIGIDLGTSNCAVAFAELSRGAAAPILDFPILQAQRPGQTAPMPLLPSCLYQPGAHELPADAARLPWDAGPAWIAGELARWQGARVPGRLVASAKSWLCHPGVDRTAPILPWGAPSEVSRISPVEASAQLLRHLAEAWNSAHPEAPLATQEVVITVPASFDEAARGLTVSAARRANLEKFTLLEEPQAAFYDFTARHRADLGRALQGVRLVLVVDVGGGTSDFTLVETGVTPEGPVLRRIAVGEHLMLGGDNMDAAVGRAAEEIMLAGIKRLAVSQWSQLIQAARGAKETLLGPSPPAEYHVSVTAEGSRLIGQSLSARLTREAVRRLVLDGFFPLTGAGELPQRGSGRLALQEVGLPYAQDPAISRHLAAFLRAHAPAAFAALGTARGPDLPRPDAILLNGGVFNSQTLSERLAGVVSGWWPSQAPVPLLHHDSLDLAVARGAAYYGLVRRGLGKRIGGGAAHGLYVGLEREGSREPLALCVVPRGQEEGETVELTGRVFELNLGQPVRFPLYSTTSDRLERAGDLVPVADDLHPLPPIHTLLKGPAGRAGRVPVHLRSTLTEVGTLELWCVSNAGNGRWRLEFELRGGAAQPALTETESVPAAFADARRWVEHIFGSKPGRASAPGAGGTLPPRDVKQLWSSLERTLGPRETWRLPVLRELWGALFAGAGRRRRSADHERVCFQLLGYALRPGFGCALDDWRSEQTFRLFSESVEFHKARPNWKEFWILWRRIAGGLTPARHAEIWACLRPHMALRVPPNAPKNVLRPKGVQPEDLDEMVRLAASLEHLDPPEKTLLGDWIVARLQRGANVSGPWTWALGRLGARSPLYASAHKAVPPDAAARWIRALLEPPVVSAEGSAFALAQLARRTGDRARDLEEALRTRVLEHLRDAAAPAAWVRLIEEVAVLDLADRALAMGDTLPAGLSVAPGAALP